MCLLLAGFAAQAQPAAMTGKWANDKSKTQVDEHTSGVLTIENRTSTWNIFNNQMFLDLSNRMRDDTLLLIYKSCDCTSTYKASAIKFPKAGSIVAKCFMAADGRLGVIYVNKKFVSSVRSYAQMSNSEKQAIFPDFFYPAK